MKKTIIPLLCLLVSLLYHPTCTQAQDQPGSRALYDSIARMDSLLFLAANSQDLKTMKTMFTRDLEFYHDASGLAGYDQTMKNFENLFIHYPNTRRALVAGSMEVYPIPGFGAIETGLHRFCRLDKGALTDCGEFKFVHIWKRTDTGWKISRVVSYGHHS